MRAARSMYSRSEIPNVTRMGSTVDTVVMTVCVLTRSPTWAFAMPTIPSIGDVIPVQVEGGLSHGRSGRGQSPTRVALGGERVVELLLADGLLRGEGREALDVL